MILAPFWMILHAEMVPGPSRGSPEEPREPRERAWGLPGSSGGVREGSQELPGDPPGSILGAIFVVF